MIGPKTLPMRAVPRVCTMNNAARMPTASGTTKRLCRRRRDGEPSTDDSTETAGVMMPSPKSMPAPKMMRNVSHVGAEALRA